MDLGIKNKRVLITGASQGIGYAIAKEFATEGCRISLIARRKEKLQKILEELGGETVGHSYYAIDLMQPNAPASAIQELTKREPFDIVVHNLGGTLNVKDPLAPMAEWQKVWQFNVGIAIEINDLLIPKMQEKKWGRIIHISSISGESLRGSAPYGAAKAYLNAYTKCLGRAVAPHNIIISALLPGAIYAEGGHWDENAPHNTLDKEAFFKKRSDFLRHHQAIGRLGYAEEIAPFAVFMASDQVTFASGSIIPIDGGTM